MKITESGKYFFECVAWSWFVFGVVSVGFELWRPSFVDYLIPVWMIFVIAGVTGLISIKK